MADYFEGSPHVTELTPQDFSDVVSWKLKDPICSAILFYSPECPFCKKVRGVWEQLGKTAKFFHVAAFNCEKHTGHLLKIKEEMPNLITGYPTMIVYSKGEPVEAIGEEEDTRTYAELLSAFMRACKGT